MTTSIALLDLHAQAAIASYADLAAGADVVQSLIAAGMTLTQAEAFDSIWDVVAPSPYVDGGFSAVLLANRTMAARTKQDGAMSSNHEQPNIFSRCGR